MDPLSAMFERWRRHGDLQALGAVFDELAPRLLPVAMHLCGHAADAEDALQQTFLAAMDRRAGFDPSRRLEPWLAGVLQNIVRNQTRFAARRRTAALPECASDEIGPLDHAEREELIAKLRTHVDALPAEQRQVVRLQLQHGLSPTAIAEALELPPGTVRMRLHRGLEALRRFLPASLAAWLAASLPAQGLAFVREQVLRVGAAEAAATAAVSVATAGGASLAFGGVLMTKKLMAVLVLVGALGALWWGGVLPPLSSVPDSPPSPSPAVAAQGVVPSAASDDPTATSRTAAPAPVGAEAAREPRPTELWGVVVDAATQQPIAGAAIELRHRDADEFWNLDLQYGARITTLARATSGTDGSFRFDVVRARPHRLAAVAAGYATTTQLHRTGGSVVTISMSRGATVTGVVRSDGKGIADANVRLAVRGESGVAWQGATDAAGAFRFTDLPATSVYVQVMAATFPEDWTRLDIAAGGQHHVEIVLEPGGTVSGRVVDATTSAPIADARVADSWTMERAVRTDAGGKFLLTGVSKDNSTMCHVEAPGYASATVRALLDGELEVRLARGSEVVGRIVDAAGSPIAGAYAAVCANYTESPGMVGADWIPARLAADGRFSANGLRADQHYWLMARAPGHGVRVYALARRLDVGERFDVGDVVMRAAGTIEGRVVDDQGAPLAGMSVSVRGANSDRGAWLAGAAQPEEVSQFSSRSAHTDDHGRFRLPSLAGGRYTVSVRPKGRDREVSAVVELADGELRENVELVVALGLTIRGVLVSLDGRPFGEALYLNAAPEAEGQWERYSTTASPDGAFLFEGLPDGLYTIALTTRINGQTLSPQFHVRAGSAVRWQLEAPSFLSGTVVDAEGKPVRASVYAFHDGVSTGSSIESTEPDGTFRIEVPTSFRGSIGAMHPDQQMVQGQVADVVAGQTDVRIQLSLPFVPR